MRQQQFIDRIEAALADEMRIEALFLGGSFGRGTADAFSDLDFVGLAAPEQHRAVAALWREAIEAISPIVFWNERIGQPSLLNAVTQDWLRVDLWMVDRRSFVDHAGSPTSHHARSTLRPVLDRDAIFRELPPSVPEAAADRQRVGRIINEFIRVLGLLAVGDGRGEHVLLVTGAGILRDMLTQLMIEETHSPERGGALHLSRVVTREQMEELRALPYPGPVRDEVVAAHWTIAKRFFPRARRLAARLDIEWPSAFEEATRRHLERAFGAEMEPW